ncbi:MAG: type II toxin-antitoxin system RelE/ParE family toxin [Treponema sp.]|jgi:mRNA-degrading endonuclease RelE of RelBE toxin-antitoxin system|nr:type II toxin-antitoxin system RelE/ParE family toxin [Treponema sp.]
MQVLLHHTADKYFNRLNAADRDRIDIALDKLEKEPPEGDIMPVVGQAGLFRTRVGAYRLLWRIKGNTVLVTHIDSRGQVYNKKNKGNKR